MWTEIEREKGEPSIYCVPPILNKMILKMHAGICADNI